MLQARSTPPEAPKRELQDISGFELEAHRPEFPGGGIRLKVAGVVEAYKLPTSVPGFELEASHPKLTGMASGVRRYFFPPSELTVDETLST